MAPRRPPSPIHTGLTRDRKLVGQAYLADPALRNAYEDEIAPRTGAALRKVFAEVAPERTGVTRALDLGAGTGAAGRAVKAHFGATVDLVSVDRVAAPGIVVADLRKPGRPSGVHGRFDLIVAGHLLNEFSAGLSADTRAALVQSWCDELLEAGGLCVILEPALRETSRGLLEVRDRLLESGRIEVVAPCFFRGPCPALERPRDWCHDAAPWLEPAAHGPRSRVDFSHLVLRQNHGKSAEGTGLRVVSDPMPEKGRLRLFVCGPAGRHELVRLDRERSEANAALDDAVRGDVLEVGLQAGARVTALTPVRRH